MLGARGKSLPKECLTKHLVNGTIQTCESVSSLKSWEESLISELLEVSPSFASHKFFFKSKLPSPQRNRIPKLFVWLLAVGLVSFWAW